MRTFSRLDDPGLALILHHGAIGVLPTDTLYGLVARSADALAVERMYSLKQREMKPGTTIAASTQQLIELGLPEDIVERVAYLWPDSVSVVIPHNLTHIHQGRGDSPFRVVPDGPLKELLLETGPLTTSSANHSGEPPATNVASARDYFGKQVDFYVDGGELGERLPSTVVGITDEGITIFREGAVKLHKKDEGTL